MGETASFGHLLVTGGAGFIGSCYVRDVLGRRDGTRITVLDKLTYAGNEANLAPVRDDPEMAARFDLRARRHRRPGGRRPLVEAVDAVVNFAAESHVDRSILDPEAFLATGVIGVHVLLEACRIAPAGRASCRSRPTRSTAPSTRATPAEDAPLAPRSPYAAAKAAGELLVRSYVITHGIDAVVTRGSNTYGPYHHPEKLIPLFITNALDDPARCRSTATGSSGATGCTSPITPRRSTSSCATAPTGRDLQRRRRRRNGRTATSSRCCSSSSASRGRSSGRSRIGPGTTAATRWTAAKLAALGWRPDDVVRGRPGRDRRLVPGQRGVVARGPLGRLGRLV